MILTRTLRCLNDKCKYIVHYRVYIYIMCVCYIAICITIYIIFRFIFIDINAVRLDPKLHAETKAGAESVSQKGSLNRSKRDSRLVEKIGLYISQMTNAAFWQKDLGA